MLKEFIEIVREDHVWDRASKIVAAFVILLLIGVLILARWG